MQQNTFLLYGANGYSGEMIARYATQYGLQPTLAGRRKEAIEPLAKELQLPYHITDLADTATLIALLQQFPLVVNAAGPYDITARPMIQACMQTNTHYMDLNGDLEVFEMLHAFHQQALDKNIMLLPGAGFDVVPTDCLALWLKNRMPDAHSLTIAFAIVGSSLSRGTSITTLQKLGLPGAVRKDGVITPEPVGKRGRSVHFPGLPKPLFTMSIPWGDISTAYYSTGIPNIVTYTGIQKGVWLFLKTQLLFNWLLRKRFVHKWITSIIQRKPAGPDAQTRQKAFSVIQAEVTNLKGEQLSATLRCAEAYELTAHTMLLIAQKIVNGHYKPGYQTPASAYGEDLIMEIRGVSRNTHL
ncbi:Uncharacterized conserved protein [Filimonas lacunae]|uniref:Uncharacterized conserved protein n=1 Tax=Filimonas lacunae TaxID=477680 RepID=A0A173MET6_9BACT|nr:saccharopine dehydrogenase NADP-binding domain-containing protein [Filimonas lacunae]BAV06104.1 integral membrane protein, Rhomboid family [Filimonas lacunae]SIT24671.1 Uncharacterized conserved protein [Filimonas lacunae]